MKFDINRALDLGIDNILRRDYKTFDLGKGKMGVAVSTASINDLFTRFLDTGLFAGFERLIEK